MNAQFDILWGFNWGENVYTLEISYNEEEFRLIGKSNRRAD